MILIEHLFSIGFMREASGMYAFCLGAFTFSLVDVVVQKLVIAQQTIIIIQIVL